MAYRFTNTEKWADPWFRKLSPCEKLAFIYMCDKCDCAGFVELDIEMMAFTTGMETEECSTAIKGLARGYLREGDFYWMKNFIRHQKNINLNPDNNAHKAIISSISKHLHLFPSIPEKIGAIKGLFSPIGKGKGRGRGRRKKGECGYSEEFERFWKEYPKNNGSKADAFKCWTSHGLDSKVDILIDSVRKFKDVAWKEKAPKYIPHCSTWLNQRRWEEDPVDTDQPEPSAPNTAQLASLPREPVPFVPPEQAASNGDVADFLRKASAMGGRNV